MRAVNLIPDEQRLGSTGAGGHSGGGALIVLVLLAGLAVLALLYGTNEHRVSTRRGELATVNAELSAARARAGRFAPYTSFIAMANDRVQAVSQLVASRFDWTHVFDELGRVLPATTALTTLQGTIGNGSGSSSSSSTAPAAPTSSTPPGSTPVFTLGGCGKSQSDVAEMLQRLRLIDGVAEVTLQSSAKSGSGSSGSGSSGSGSCPAGDPAFTVQVTFQPLPAAAATSPQAVASEPSTGATR